MMLRLFLLELALVVAGYWIGRCRTILILEELTDRLADSSDALAKAIEKSVNLQSRK